MTDPTIDSILGDDDPPLNTPEEHSLFAAFEADPHITKAAELWLDAIEALGKQGPDAKAIACALNEISMGLQQRLIWVAYRQGKADGRTSDNRN